MSRTIKWPDSVDAQFVQFRALRGPIDGPRYRGVCAALPKTDISDRALALAVWLADLLEERVGIDPVRDWYTTIPAAVWTGAERAVTDGLAVTAVVTAGRYLAVYGYNKVYDAKSGTVVTAVPHNWLGAEVLNLFGIVDACVNRVPK